MPKLFFIFLLLMIFGCKGIFQDAMKPMEIPGDTLKTAATKNDTALVKTQQPLNDTLYPAQISLTNIPADSIIAFAKTLIGTPYLYASTDPQKGFDCSGFITYVFNHFKINVPRSSIDFTNVGTTIPLQNSKKGDLILFTGTDSTEKFVGHMGIIILNDNGDLQFIHSSSGKANGVVITPLNDYYKGRFVKVVRL